MNFVKRSQTQQIRGTQRGGRQTLAASLVPALCFSLALVGFALHASYAEAQSFSAPDITVTEGNNAEFQVQGQSPPGTFFVKYRYETVDGTAISSGDCADYESTSGEFKITQWNPLKVSVQVYVDCYAQEPDEEFKMKFYKVPNSLVENYSFFLAWPTEFEMTATIKEDSATSTSTFGE